MVGFFVWFLVIQRSNLIELYEYNRGTSVAQNLHKYRISSNKRRPQNRRRSNHPLKNERRPQIVDAYQRFKVLIVFCYTFR